MLFHLFGDTVLVSLFFIGLSRGTCLMCPGGLVVLHVSVVDRFAPSCPFWPCGDYFPSGYIIGLVFLLWRRGGHSSSLSIPLRYRSFCSRQPSLWPHGTFLRSLQMSLDTTALLISCFFLSKASRASIISSFFPCTRFSYTQIASLSVSCSTVLYHLDRLELLRWQHWSRRTRKDGKLLCQPQCFSLYAASLDVFHFYSCTVCPTFFLSSGTVYESSCAQYLAVLVRC